MVVRMARQQPGIPEKQGIDEAEAGKRLTGW